MEFRHKQKCEKFCAKRPTFQNFFGEKEPGARGRDVKKSQDCFLRWQLGAALPSNMTATTQKTNK